MFTTTHRNCDSRQDNSCAVRIFKIGKDVTLHCAPNENAAAATLALEQSILETILREYRTGAGIIEKIAQKSSR